MYLQVIQVSVNTELEEKKKKKKAYLIAPDKRGYPHNIFLLSPRKHVVDTHYKRLKEALQTSNEISFK